MSANEVNSELESAGNGRELAPLLAAQAPEENSASVAFAQASSDRDVGPGRPGLKKGNRRLAQSDYQQLVEDIHRVAQATVPIGSTVAVISKGDALLLNFDSRNGWHFPQNNEGRYAGYYPVCSSAAIAHLESLRARGAQYLLIPSSAFWWFEHYQGFGHHLTQRYHLLKYLEDTCAIYCLEQPAQGSLATHIAQIAADFQNRFHAEPVILDWDSQADLAHILPELTVFHPPRGNSLPYLDHSVDLVVTGTEDEALLGEARRVAKGGLVKLWHRRAGKETLVETEWLRPARARRKPSVSIIVPCHNGSALTEGCLRSLTETLPNEFAIEIVVVDDASSDDTPEILREWAAGDGRIRVMRNRKNLGFVGACNRGARRASGELLVFLNNDVILLPGWLPPLWRTFRDFPGTGAVGGKLIYPDGTLQEAGGVVFADGSAMNFGGGDTDLEKPLYNFVREVDYCSAALLATKRALFMELGGFDRTYAPGYFEDTDYCFRLRQRGRKVFYQPESAVVHREGGTAGTDLNQGMKAYQKLNQVRFARRWKRALERQPASPSKIDQALLQELAFRSLAEQQGRW